MISGTFVKVKVIKIKETAHPWVQRSHGMQNGRLCFRLRVHNELFTIHKKYSGLTR